MRPWWKPLWTVPAGLRALRATLVVPALFAICLKVIGDPQMTLFATFGGFATLVVANFGGTRKDKFAGHVGLAVVGSLALIIGTLVSGTAWIAVVVTLPVTFAIFFAGIIGPNPASGAIPAMFAYVLPVVSVGGAGDLPSRLEGWWLAAAAGTIAVLLLSPPAPGNRLRAAAGELAGELAGRLRAAAAGQATTPEAMRAAKDRLRAAFDAAPYRPTGLATADQALSSMVQLLEWSATQVGDAFDGHVDLAHDCPEDRNLLNTAADMFADAQALLAGRAADPDFGALEAARARSADHLAELSGRPGEPDARTAAAQAVHAQGIAVVARSVAADALIVSHRASAETVEMARRHWYGSRITPPGSADSKAASPAGATGLAGLAGVGSLPGVAGLAGSAGVANLTAAATLVRRHASVRSVWFLNSARAAIALAAAVAVADASGVQHAFWVVLGTLSVLRTSASATGSTAWRGLAGTAVGFVIGAALLVGIGTNPNALWAVFPVAVLIAAYAPGTTPFLVGQAAFTITVVVLFNLLVPVGWTVGLLRVEDVAIGCGVSFAVGVLLWPRGVSAVVGDDLADSFRAGAAFLTEAVDWALSEVLVPPDASIVAAGAAIRLDDAVRGFLTEQGSKRLTKEDLWTLVNASSRLRQTAHSLATLRPAVPAQVNGQANGQANGHEGGQESSRWSACVPLAGSGDYAGGPACTSLRNASSALAGFYDAIADEVSRPGKGALAAIPAPMMVAAAVPRQPATPASPASPATSTAARSAGEAGDDHESVTDGSGGAGLLSAVQELPHPHLLWVQEHLHHLSKSAQTVSEPALHLAEIRSRPWWR
ncbi:MAG TPA: FUSC family protein [Trebonia sp.]|nr:FUSC family protein [Trebonia sp.]